MQAVAAVVGRPQCAVGTGKPGGHVDEAAARAARLRQQRVGPRDGALQVGPGRLRSHGRDRYEPDRSRGRDGGLRLLERRAHRFGVAPAQQIVDAGPQHHRLRLARLAIVGDAPRDIAHRVAARGEIIGGHIERRGVEPLQLAVADQQQPARRRVGIDSAEQAVALRAIGARFGLEPRRAPALRVDQVGAQQGERHDSVQDRDVDKSQSNPHAFETPPPTTGPVRP